MSKSIQEKFDWLKDKYTRFDEVYLRDDNVFFEHRNWTKSINLKNHTVYDVNDYVKDGYMCTCIQQDLKDQYPHLHFAVQQKFDGLYASVWVNPDGEGPHGASVGFVEHPIHAPAFHDELQKLNKEARESKQEDMFFCSGHQRAEPEEHYSYFYFAGEFCEEWKENHPKHHKKAKKENYR